MQEAHKQLIDNDHASIGLAIDRLVAALPPSLQKVADHVFNAGGKRLRPLLLAHFAALFHCKEEAIYDVAAAIEAFHVATLLHDDVIDKASLRRGVPCAHEVFGANIAILSGDALLAMGSKIVASQGDTALSMCMAEVIVQTTYGEVLEIESQGQIAPDLDNYFAIIHGKTAWMFQTACEIGTRFAKASEKSLVAAHEFGKNLGFAFQIIDDVLDFYPAEITGKPAGGDLREGKYTPPIHAYVQSLPADERAVFAKDFSQGTFTDEAILKLVEAVHAGNFLTESRKMAEGYIEKALESLSILQAEGADAERIEMLKQIVQHMGSRMQ